MENGGMEQDEILKKLKLKKVPQNVEENYSELQKTWERECVADVLQLSQIIQ